MLGIADNQIGNLGTIEIFSGLKKNSYLKYLDFGSNQISEFTLVKISDLLLFNKSLQVLDFYGIEFGDVGAKGIKKLLQMSKYIHTIILGNTDVSPELGLELIKEASKSETLRELRWGNLQSIHEVEKIETKFN